MANEDVRVRFSAEGLADVVTAFRTVSTESKKSAAEAGGAWSEFGDEVKDLGKELVGFLALGALFDTFKESIASAFEHADQIDDFAKATGLSTDAVQGLTAAATKNHIAVDQVEASVGKLNVTIGKARQGSKEALAPFDQLKINFQDLQKLSPDQQFQEIASKLAAVKNPADQAAIGVQLFGKQFEAIKPVIDDVAKDGLQSYIDHMRDLGILLSGDTVTAMKEVNEQFAELKTRGQGATAQFVSGLVPALQASMDTFLQATESGADGLKSVGEIVGDVLKGLVVIAVTVGKAIGDLVGAAVESAKGYIGATKDAVVALASGDFAKIPDAFAKGVQNNATQLKTLIASIKKDASDTVNSLFNSEPKKPAEGGEGAIGAGDDSENIARLKALGQARYQLISAQLDAELAIYTAHAQLLEEQEKQQYQDGTISLQQYYSDRAKIINDEFDKEVATLKAKRAAAAAVPTSQNDAAAQVAQQAQIAQIDGQLQLKEIARQQALAENTVEQRAAQKQLYTDQLTAESKLAQLQGDRYAASQAQLKIQLQQLDDLLKKGGVSDADRQAALDAARAQAEAMAQFNDQKEQADSQLKSLSTAIAGVQGDIANGTLFQAEGEEKIIELEKSRLPVLQQIAAAQLAAAQASKDPQALATAEQFAQKVKDIANATDLAGQYMAQLKQGAQDAFQNGLSEFLTDGIQDVHNLGDAFKSLISDILKGIQRVAAEMASQQATKALFGALTGLFGGGGGDINEIPSTDYIGSYSNFTASARGNVFADGAVIKAFAAGGAFTNGVAMQPTMAPMALFGEAGPEAIVPLVRDSNGNLGVRSSGGSGGGGDINMETNIVLDSSGNQQSQQGSSSNDLLRQFGDQMNQLAKQSIQREMQPGGLLWRWRNGQ